MVDVSLAGFTSGSSFSNYFDAPSYQSNLTATYVASLKGADSGLFNKTGRAFPDVTAQGSRQAIVVNGSVVLVRSFASHGQINQLADYVFVQVGGTSASSPIFAGGLALLNSLLIAAGKPTTGWIHPTLYSHPEAFTDITDGGSFSCKDRNDTSLGFPAGPGWDASSGLGTPILPALRKVFSV